MRLAHHIRFYLRSMTSDEGGGVGVGVGENYEVRLKGRLDARWAAWFDGLGLTHEGAGTTVMHGPVADQAALHGLLSKVRDLACHWSRPLASARLGPTQPPSSPTRCSPTCERHKNSESSNACKGNGRALPHHLHHLDPRLVRVLRPRSQRPRLHHRCSASLRS